MPATAVPAMRTLGQVCQPVSTLPSIVRAAGPWLSAFPLPHKHPQIQTQFREPSAFSWKSELCCSALRSYPSLAALLEAEYKTVNDTASERVPVQPVDLATQVVVADTLEEAGEAFKFARNVSPPVQHSPESKNGSAAGSSEHAPQPERSKASKSVSRPEASEATHSSPALAAAHMIMRDYETRLQQLEKQCRELSGENYRLQAELFMSQKSQERGRELNLLLSRKVRETREQCSEAVAQVGALTQDLDHLRASRSTDVPDLQEKSPVPEKELESMLFILPPGLAGPTPETLASAACCNDGMSAWGCEEHQVYTQRLMLAHQALSLSVAAGPPGLEPVEQAVGVGFRTQRAEDLVFKLHSKARSRQHGRAAPKQQSRKMKVHAKRQA